MLVAPVIDQGASEVKTYLPADTWIHMFTGEEHQGPGWVTTPAPLGRPTAFYRMEANPSYVEVFKKVGSCKVMLKITDISDKKKTEEEGGKKED